MFCFKLIGPAESLFQKPYYELMKCALKPGGIICTQGEKEAILVNVQCKRLCYQQVSKNTLLWPTKWFQFYKLHISSASKIKWMPVKFMGHFTMVTSASVQGNQGASGGTLRITKIHYLFEKILIPGSFEWFILLWQN